MIQSIHPEAEAEFEAAVEFYNLNEDGLGDQFAEAVFAAIDRVVDGPTAWPKYSHRTRRCFCHRFPYSVIYRHTDEEVTIFAIAHQSRKPGYWKDRVN